jgi:hypothetical protein
MDMGSLRHTAPAGKACQRSTCSGGLFRRPRSDRDASIRVPQPGLVDELLGQLTVAVCPTERLTLDHGLEGFIWSQDIAERATQCRRQTPERRKLDRSGSLRSLDLGHARLGDSGAAPQFKLAHPEGLTDCPDPASSRGRSDQIQVPQEALVEQSSSV